MDLIEIGEAQTAIAQRVFAGVAGAEWEQLRCYWASVGGARAVWLVTLDAAGELGTVDAPAGLDELFGALKTGMADPERGAWYLAELGLSRTGDYRFDYEYERRIAWNPDVLLDPYAAPAGPPEPGDDLWRAEFAAFPRTPERWPVWLPRLVSEP